MNEKIKIVLADDHPVLLQGLELILSTKPNIEICGTASNGTDALRLIKSFQPEIAVLDVQMPGLDGYEIAQRVFTENINTQIIFLTMYKEEEFIKNVIDLGVKGYILKENAVNDIINCIESVSNGEFFISPQVSNVLLNINKKPEKQSGVLTSAETKILSLISGGKSSQQIAQELFISIKTVENHRSNICKKLGITGNSALLKYALKYNPENNLS